MRIRLTFISALLAFSVRAPAGEDFSKVEIKATHVAGNIYMLSGSGGNIGVSAGPDGILLVDDQFAPLFLRRRQEAPEGVGEGVDV